MKNWNDLISKIKNPSLRSTAYLTEGDQSLAAAKKSKQLGVHESSLSSTHTRKMYFLGGILGGYYLTQREAECILHLLRGCTIVKTAAILQLSSRTVEYYIKNIKMKLGVRTKSELISLISSVGFVE